MNGDHETGVLAGQAVGVKSFLYSGGDLFEFTKKVISARFVVGAVDSAEAASKASRS